MAVEVLFTIAGGILKTLGPLITNEIVLLWGFQNELQSLERTVTTIQAVLLDAEARRATSNAVSLWLGQLNDILYEADDLLDAISTEVQLGKIARDKKAKKVCTFSPILKHPAHVLKMAHSLREIKGKIDAIAADISRFQFLVRPEEGLKGWGRGDTYSDLGVESVIGRDNDKKAVIGRLMASNVEGNVSIVPIVGIGGLGKTTLAKLIFNDPKIQETFELKIWICVSDPFDVIVIVKKILKSVKEKFCDDDPMDELVKHLRKGIEGKKYLLVLDDVWCEISSHWSELNNLLMYGGSGSKILVTTRKLRVANILRTEPHKLDGLREDDSWELLKQVALVTRSESRNFQKIGREILKKCKGVPLAVKTVGRLLYSKGIEEWQKFIKDELSKIPQEEAEIIPTLKLSYDELPSYLKHCFAFCSLFPKDHEFKITTLINHWIAQGFVNSQENQCLEDIGYEYFMNLLWRSFFQEIQMDKFGNIIGCKMHDLMHDLATLVSESEIITFPSQKSINYQKIRHVAFTQCATIDSSTLSSLYGASMIRTFFCPLFFTLNDNSHCVEVDCRDIIKHFESLRTLDLSNNKLHDVLRYIGKLKHLRFLNLSYNSEIEMLPSSITKLANLQSLCLTKFYQLQCLPCGFEKLIKLRHLDASYCRKLRCLPHGMGQLKELQTLNLKDCDSLEQLPQDIGKLVKLRHLDANNCRKLRCLPHEMGQLKELQTLDLKDCYSLEQLPQDIGKLVKLRHLDANNCRKLRCLPNEMGQLKELQTLNLKNCCSLEQLPQDIGKLVKLRHLDANNCRKLRCLPHEVGQLKELQTLNLNNCCSLEQLPKDIGKLVNLRFLDMRNCTKLKYLPRGFKQLTILNWLIDIKEFDLSSSKDAGGLDELSNLNDLGGNLTIRGLNCGKGVVTQYKAGNLKGKKNLNSLCLEWSSEVVVSDLDDDMSLEVLQPHQNLAHLKLLGCWCPRPPSWLSLLSNLVSLTLNGCNKWQYLTPLSHLFSLESLSLCSLKNIEYISKQSDFSLSSSADKSFFPSLKEMTLRNCPNLKGWWGGSSMKDDYLALSFCLLSKLEIRDCPMLTSIPMFPHLEKLLVLSSLKPLQQTLVMNTISCLGTPLLKLKELEFNSVANLEALRLQNLTSLKILKFDSCDKLKSLSPGIQYLAAIQKLFIDRCPMFVEDENGMPWKGFQSLIDLKLWRLPKLSSLPLGLQYVTTLESIWIDDCEGLTTIGGWIHQCLSLEYLTIWDCPNLASLPVEMCEQWSLKGLQILRCPILSQKCEKKKGEYWWKIAHIPDLYVSPPPKSKSILQRRFHKIWDC